MSNPLGNYKKIYTIEITGARGKAGIWYSDKLGRQFEAELQSTKGHSTAPVFMVNPCQFVHLIDCKVVGEKVVERYTKPF